MVWAASAGLSLLQFCNLNSFRSKFILGFSLFMGLSVPQYFKEYVFVTGHGPVHTSTISVSMPLSLNHLMTSPLLLTPYDDDILIIMQFNNIVQVIFQSPATVAAIVAFFLDCTLDRAHSSTRADSGRHWWGKFRSFHTDTRSEEFYSLPCNLNKYFPSV